jgi:hypothetical protein
VALPDIDLPLWGDGSLWGDGDLYTFIGNVPFAYSADQEVQPHRLSLRLNYTAFGVVGFLDGFRIHSLRLRLAPGRQAVFTHDAFIDGVVNSTRIAVALTHSGSEFIVSHIQLIASRKKHMPKG